MKKLVPILLVFWFVLGATASESMPSKAEDRLRSAGEVLSQIQGAPDQGLPEDVLGSAQCVAVVPAMLNGGFVFGARYGRGVASCRTPKGWSAPAFFVISGGSFGFQIGGEAVDLVMLIMNDDGMQQLLSSRFKIGAQASASGGPVGRTANADTDWKLHAQVLSYSRSRGLFAGVDLSGAQIKPDQDSTRQFYGYTVPFRTSLAGKITSPDGAYPFLNELAKWAKAAANK